MNRRGGTREIVNLVNFEQNRFGYVVANQFKLMIVEQVNDVFASAGEKIVERDDFVAFVKQSFAQMRADKARAAGYKYSHNLRIFEFQKL
jgi:hypothetical protein